MGSDDRATAADAPARIDLANEPPFVLAGAEVRPATLEVVAAGRRELLEPRVMMFLREFEEAAAVSREILQVSPGNDGARLCLGVSCAHMGDLTEAARVLAGAGPGEKPDWSRRHEMYRNSADRDLVRSGLRLAGARV
jgi:hypothetical protein